MNVLTDQLQRALDKSIDSLAGKVKKGMLDGFNVYSAEHVNRIAKGFILLRQAGLLDASRLLVRPAMEAVYKIIVLKSQPNLLYRIAYSEHLEDKKWARSFNPNDEIRFRELFEKKWCSFDLLYKECFPDHVIKKSKLKLWDIAKISGLDSFYNSHYLLYSNFTHGTLRAMIGDLVDFGESDERIMMLCLITAIESVVESGGVCLNLDTLKLKLTCGFDKQQ